MAEPSNRAGVPVFRVKGEILILARLLPSAGHRRQRSLSRLTRRWKCRWGTRAFVEWLPVPATLAEDVGTDSGPLMAVVIGPRTQPRSDGRRLAASVTPSAEVTGTRRRPATPTPSRPGCKAVATCPVT